MKSTRTYGHCILVMGVAMVVSGMGVAIAEAENLQNHMCVFGLNPLTCDSVGNSICNEESGTIGTCGATCFYCPGSGTVPSRYCVVAEGYVCASDPSEKTTCTVAGVTQIQGECEQQGSCICTNTMPNGNDCGNFEDKPSCTGSSS